MMILGSLLITLLLASGHAYNILIIHPTPSYSHQQPVMVLTESLIKRGHQLYVVSTNAVPGLEKNYTYVDVSFMYKYLATKSEDKGEENVNLQVQHTKWNVPSALFTLYSKMAAMEFNSTQFSKFYEQVRRDKIKFDVALMETFFISSSCAMIRHLGGYDVPTIVISTIPHAVCGGEDNSGSIDHPSYLPFWLSSYTDRMNIWQKIDNWLSKFFIDGTLKNMLESAARNYFREAYSPEYETLVDGCWSNMSLSIITSNFLYNYPRLLAPNVVETGPMHIKKELEKLPQSIEDWLDGAELGVVLFSLGSNMQSASLPESVRSNFLKYFAQLPAGYRVVWKWEAGGKVPGQSDNILAIKWSPQQSILAHPKLKVFITQGGLQSFQEAVHYGVPTVGIPWFGDQEMNVAKMIDAGIGTRILPKELQSYEKIKSAIDAVLYDDGYMKNMKRLSAISQDFTSQAVDKAVFWVEHVARFGGASHLRPSTAVATYFEFFCYDIISVILILSLILLYLVKLAYKFLLDSVFLSPKIKRKIS
uniref:UDP-glucuronosyltransferase n=1 Tax=Trialeurodes vaporariorum TaxID=88556 RepID=A0A873P518_TRIVP|nr:UDP-gluconosyltransferase [Trialeurodes vaporariorum]